MASGTRGYSSYRGRGRKGKIFLAILLILIILGSVGFIMAREHMRYDADGNLHFDLPWDKGTSDPVEAPGDPDVVIREPEQTAVKTPVRGTLLAAKPLTMEEQETAETPLSEMTVTAVTLKDSAGRVYFDSSAAVTGAVSVKPDTGEALNDLTARTDVTAAARIACFHDPKAANADVEGMGLKNTGGYIFYDGNNSQWMDPGHEKARTYLLNIIREAAEQGFREIILTDVSYPTAGKLDKIDFSNAMTAGNTAEAGRQAQIEGFLREVRDALPKNVILSLELPAETVLAGTNSDAGQELSALAPLVDHRGGGLCIGDCCQGGVRCLWLCAGVDGAACRRYGKLAADPKVNEQMKRNPHCENNVGSFCLQLAEKFPVPVDFYGDGGKLRVRGQKFVGKGEVLPLVHGQKPADLHQIQKIVRPQIAARFQPGVQGKHGQIDAAAPERFCVPLEIGLHIAVPSQVLFRPVPPVQVSGVEDELSLDRYHPRHALVGGGEGLHGDAGERGKGVMLAAAAAFGGGLRGKLPLCQIVGRQVKVAA